MKKVEIIRELFDTLMSCGYSDNKQDAISEYTKDKLENTIYVKKLDIKNLPNVDSIAITCLESDFSDACDCDVRVAFCDKNIGKRVILYANECGIDILNAIRENILNFYTEYKLNIDNYNKVCNLLSTLQGGGMSSLFLSDEIDALKYVLEKYKNFLNIN